ncbi:MAG: FliH/SctL family protein [Polyangiaceae bacterium]
MLRPKSVPPPPAAPPSRPLPSWAAPRPIRSDARPTPFTRQGRRQTGSFTTVEPQSAAARAGRTVVFSSDPPPRMDAHAPTASMAPASIGAASVMEVARATSMAPPFMPEPTATELSLQAEIVELQAALTAAVAETARVRREVLQASAPELVRLAAAIAEQVIGQRMEKDPTLLAALAREGIDALLESDELTVAVAPDLADKVPPEAWARALEGRAAVVTDPTLDAMRCEVRGKSSRVFVDPRSRLRVVLDALDDAALEAPASSSRGPRSAPTSSREGSR